MRSRSRQSGFVLVITIWILAAVAIGAAYFADRVEKSLRIAQARQDMSGRLIEIENARAEILIRLATNRFFQWGVGRREASIALDDRPYRIGGGFIQLQDQRGLLSINGAGPAQEARLSRFLGAFGIPPEQRSRLIDSLEDYFDGDDLRRLNGAESREYLEAGLAPPRNAALITPLELKRVMGWRDTPALWGSPSVADLVSCGDAGGINPNTAPIEVLLALPGVTPEIARQIIERRRIDQSVNDGILSQLTGLGSESYVFAVMAFPANRLRVTQRVPGLPWAIRYNLRMTPRGDFGPWVIDNEHRIEQKEDLTSGSVFGSAPELASSAALATDSTAPFFLPR